MSVREITAIELKAIELKAIERVAERKYTKLMNSGLIEREAANQIVKYLYKVRDLFTSEGRGSDEISYIGGLIEGYSFII